MTRQNDRLSDIWTRFGQGTNARLTGASVEHTVRPSRADNPRHQAPGRALAEAITRPAREGTPDPVAAAKQALQASMAANRNRSGQPVSAAVPEDLIAMQVLRDMKATEARVARRETDYLSYAAAMQGKGMRKRRKFLGLF